MGTRAGSSQRETARCGKTGPLCDWGLYSSGNLTDYGVGSELLEAYGTLSGTLEQSNTPLPENTIMESGIYLKRALDCAVIKTVHKLRADSEIDAYQQFTECLRKVGRYIQMPD